MTYRPSSFLESNLTAQPSNHIFRNSQFNWSHSQREDTEGQGSYPKSIYKPNLNVRPNQAPSVQTLVSSSLQNYSNALFLTKRGEKPTLPFHSTKVFAPETQKENKPGTVSHLIIKAMVDQSASTKWNQPVSSRQRASSVQGAKISTQPSSSYISEEYLSYNQNEKFDGGIKGTRGSANLLLTSMKRDTSSKSGLLSQPSKLYKSSTGDKSAREDYLKRELKTPKSVNYQVTCSTERSKGVVEAFGICTTQGITKDYNEDGVSIIMNVVQEDKSGLHANLQAKNNFSYFSVFDGHGGTNCVNYLKDNLHYKILNDPQFPSRCDQAIFNGVLKAEKEFLEQANKNNGFPDKSGACCLIVLFKGSRF